MMGSTARVKQTETSSSRRSTNPGHRRRPTFDRRGRPASPPQRAACGTAGKSAGHTPATGQGSRGGRRACNCSAAGPPPRPRTRTGRPRNCRRRAVPPPPAPRTAPPGAPPGSASPTPTGIATVAGGGGGDGRAGCGRCSRARERRSRRGHRGRPRGRPRKRAAARSQGLGLCGGGFLAAEAAPSSLPGTPCRHHKEHASIFSSSSMLDFEGLPPLPWCSPKISRWGLAVVACAGRCDHPFH
ncbi:unnamed protein product [Musa banksii]